MKVFAVSYDLRYADERQYQRLYDALTQLGGIRVLKSTWTLKLDDDWDCRKVGNELVRYIHETDGIYVAEVIASVHRRCENTPHRP